MNESIHVNNPYNTGTKKKKKNPKPKKNKIKRMSLIFVSAS